jgi:hypothetical protein
MDELRLRPRGEGQSGAMRIESKPTSQGNGVTEPDRAISPIPVVEVMDELPSGEPQGQTDAQFIDNPKVFSIHEHSIAHEVM